MRSLKKCIFLIRLLFSFHPRSVNSAKQFILFLRSTNLVGSRIDRTYYRFKDLTLLKRCNFLQGNVIEFGSGSSTIFFTNLPKVKEVKTIEENREYLLPSLEKNKKKLKITIAPRVELNTPIIGSKYDLDLEFISASEPNFIYVDGPSCISMDEYFALPCLDLVSIPPKSSAVYAIDARTATVMFLNIHLKNTHNLFPSRSFCRELERYRNYFESKFQYRFDYESKKRLHGYLIRTSVFLPKNKDPSFLIRKTLF